MVLLNEGLDGEGWYQAGLWVLMAIGTPAIFGAL